MRISGLVTFATMAISALASPLYGASGVQETAASTATETVSSCTQVITILEGSIVKIQDRTSSISTYPPPFCITRHLLTKDTDSTVARVESGDMDKEDGTKYITGEIEGIKVDLTKIVTSLTGAAVIKIEAGQVDRVLALVNILLRELLATVNYAVTTLSLGDTLSGLLKVVFGLVAKILILLIGLLGGLLPGLLTILASVLKGLGHGLLAPILKPVLTLVTGLGVRL